MAGFIIDTSRPRYGEWTFGWWPILNTNIPEQATMLLGLPGGTSANNDETASSGDSRGPEYGMRHGARQRNRL